MKDVVTDHFALSISIVPPRGLKFRHSDIISVYNQLREDICLQVDTLAHESKSTL